MSYFGPSGNANPITPQQMEAMNSYFIARNGTSQQDTQNLFNQMGINTSGLDFSQGLGQN